MKKKMAVGVLGVLMLAITAGTAAAAEVCNIVCEWAMLGPLPVPVGWHWECHDDGGGGASGGMCGQAYGCDDQQHAPENP